MSLATLPHIHFASPVDSCRSAGDGPLVSSTVRSRRWDRLLGLTLPSHVIRPHTVDKPPLPMLLFRRIVQRGADSEEGSAITYIVSKLIPWFKNI